MKALLSKKLMAIRNCTSLKMSIFEENDVDEESSNGNVEQHQTVTARSGTPKQNALRKLSFLNRIN